MQVHFVEMDPWVVSAVLEPNLEWTGFLDLSVIHTVRVEDFLARAEIYTGMASLHLLNPLLKIYLAKCKAYALIPMSHAWELGLSKEETFDCPNLWKWIMGH